MSKKGNTMKLAVYAIAKNEQHHVRRWYESVKDADMVFVLDTGSEDQTYAILQELALEVNNLRVARFPFPDFRFDMARNVALSHVTTEQNCMFLTSDLDEVFEEGGIAKIKQAINEQTADVFTVELVYTFDENMQPKISYPREALHTKEFFWKYPVHELLTRDSNAPYKVQPLEVKTFHMPDSDKPRDYFRLLELAVTENPDDPRCVQYMGREYMYRGELFEAIQWLKRHIVLEPHGPFRSESATYIADCYKSLDGSLEEALDEAESWYLRSIAEFNRAREPFCALATLYMVCGEYESAIGMIRSALRIPKAPDVSMISTPEYYNGIWCEHLLFSCYYNLGDIDKAKRVVNSVLANNPDRKYPQSFLNDVAKVYGVEHADKHIDNETKESEPRHVPGDEAYRTGQVPRVVPQEQAPLLNQAEAEVTPQE